MELRPLSNLYSDPAIFTARRGVTVLLAVPVRAGGPDSTRWPPVTRIGNEPLFVTETDDA
jgi:hypothetical protein